VYPYNKTRTKWTANIEKPTYYPESLNVRNYLGGTVVEGTIILKWILQKFDMGLGLIHVAQDKGYGSFP
jgi:hypothetical protein